MRDGETKEGVPVDVMIHKPAEREVQWMQANREALVERIARVMREDGTAQPLVPAPALLLPAEEATRPLRSATRPHPQRHASVPLSSSP